MTSTVALECVVLRVKSNVKKIFQSLQEEQMLAELPDDPGPAPEVLFRPMSLECIRLGKFPEAIGYNCLHDTVLEMGSRVVKGEGQ